MLQAWSAGEERCIDGYEDRPDLISLLPLPAKLLSWNRRVDATAARSGSSGTGHWNICQDWGWQAILLFHCCWSKGHLMIVSKGFAGDFARHFLRTATRVIVASLEAAVAGILLVGMLRRWQAWLQWRIWRLQKSLDKHEASVSRKIPSYSVCSPIQWEGAVSLTESACQGGKFPLILLRGKIPL